MARPERSRRGNNKKKRQGSREGEGRQTVLGAWGAPEVVLREWKGYAIRYP